MMSSRERSRARHVDAAVVEGDAYDVFFLWVQLVSTYVGELGERGCVCPGDLDCAHCLDLFT